MKKLSDENTATSAVAGYVGAINDRIPLPAGVELGLTDNLTPVYPRSREVRLA